MDCGVLNWSQKRVKVSDLKPYERNPRKITEEAFARLIESLKQNGYHQRIIATPDLKVIGGHQRIKALKEIGLTEVDILVPDRKLTEEEYRRILLQDNLHYGEFDLDVLSADFTVDELEEWGLPDQVISKLEMPQDLFKTDKDDAPSPPSVAVTARGDVWILGEHRLRCGDSTSVEDITALMAGEKADQLVTDPPYNVAYEGKTKDALTIQNDEMGDADFRQFLRSAMFAADSVMKEGASFYIWHADSEGYNFRGACQDIGWKVRQCLIWLKDSMVMGRQDYHWKHEPCLYGWKEGAAHYWGNDRKQTTIIECKRPTRNDIHPTMKPVELIEYLIGNNTKAGDIVLDSFGGSGSTLIACEIHNRKARLCELDEKYCDAICKRWMNFTGKKVYREGDGMEFPSQ